MDMLKIVALFCIGNNEQETWIENTSHLSCGLKTYYLFLTIKYLIECDYKLLFEVL